MKNNNFIKEFRIYTIDGDDGNGKMIYNNLDKFISITPEGLLNSVHHILQYTNRKDINNIKIFEGDIVKRMDSKVSFIEYRENGFWVNSEDVGWENLWSWEHMEVIGNIYQNRNLLS